MYAIIRNGQPVELDPNKSFVDKNDIRHLSYVLRIWTPQELATIDVYAIQEDTVPPGKRVTGSSLEFTGSAVLRHWTLEDIPVIPPVVPPRVSKYQFKKTLLNSSKYNDAVAVMNAASTDLKLLWTESRFIPRNGALVAHLQTELSLTNTQVDNFFFAAAQVDD